MFSVPYSDAFFAARSRETEVAKSVLGFAMAAVRPQSVVDLGTAAGAWLYAAKTFGVTDVFGLDGPWVPRERLLILPAEFMAIDFEKPLPALGRRFDLAICTEVLEHISPSAAQAAVAWLCQHAPAVLFSAAIPNQGGRHHVNEAWPSRWACEFAAHGLKAYDVIRPRIWADRRIPVWYRQNAILMLDDSLGQRLALPPTSPEALDIVHPDLYLRKIRRLNRLDSRSVAGRYKALRRALGGF